MVKRVLITGARGFIGRNLVAELSREPEKYELMLSDIDTPEAELCGYLGACDFVVHLAGVNRPKSDDEFASGNANFTIWMLDKLREVGNTVPVAITSSVQAMLDNAYGKSKLEAERAMFAYRDTTDAPVFVWRLPNVFGKWCRPNYNSAVATFCHNIAHGLSVQVNDPSREMTLIYIDDLIALLKTAISKEAQIGSDGYAEVVKTYTCTLQYIPDKLMEFRESRRTLVMPSLRNGLDSALYATYLTYLDSDDFAYTLNAHSDARGAFAEIMRSLDAGQISFSTTAPGITRGNHWHHSKNEKFVVISGQATVRFRRIDGDAVNEYNVCGERPTVIDIPPGYTHNITNSSPCDVMVMLIWASELFDPERTDTYPMEV